MTTITPDAESICGAGALARLIGVSEQQVRQLNARGIIQQIPNHRGKYKLIDTVSRYTEHLREQAAGRSMPQELAKAKLLKLKAEAAKAQMQAAAMQGSLISADSIEARWNSSSRILRATLLAMASRLTQRLNLSNENAAVAKQEINDALSEVAESGLEQVRTEEMRGLVDNARSTG